MRKLLVLFLLTASLSSLMAGNLSLSLSADLMRPRDERYRQIYGNLSLMGEIRASYCIYGDYYLWAGYALLPDRGHTLPRLSLESTIYQHFFSFGVGFRERLLKHFGYKVELGGSYVFYRESALGTSATGGGFGFRGEIGLVFFLSKKYFTELNFGYIAAYEKQEIETLKFGGFKAGIAFGMKL